MFKRVIGILALLGGIGLFSTVELCQKLIREQCGTTIDPYMMVFVRFLFTGTLLLLLGLPMFYRSGKHFNAKDFWILLLNGAVTITGCLVLFHLGVDMFQNASSAAVVFSANAIFVVILARFINGEPWTWIKWFAMLLGLAGISMFIFEKGTPDEATFKAIGVMSISAFLFALGVCITKRVIARYGTMVYMGGSSIMGCFLVLPLFFMLSKLSFMEAIEPMKDAWTGMAYMVCIATALGYILYYYGISCTSAFHASMAFMLKPVLACLLGLLASHTGFIKSESAMNAYTITGAVLIVSAMLMAQICQKGAGKGAAPKKNKR